MLKFRDPGGALCLNSFHKVLRVCSCQFKVSSLRLFSHFAKFMAGGAWHVNVNKRRPLGQMADEERRMQNPRHPPQQVQGKIIRCSAATGTPPLAISLGRNEKTFAAIKIAEQENTKKKPSAGEYSMQIGLAVR